jgi:hypothetical protein
MEFTTLFIQAPNNWEKLTAALMALTQGTASDVRFIATADEISDSDTTIDVVVTSLKGKADYALEIFWKGMTTLADDAIGVYVAMGLTSDVIVRYGATHPYTWQLLGPTGTIEEIQIDHAKLVDHCTVSYNFG